MQIAQEVYFEKSIFIYFQVFKISIYESIFFFYVSWFQRPMELFLDTPIAESPTKKAQRGLSSLANMDLGDS